jgi:mannose-6-phosphate isomerase-like protein (cupin superfamily)
MTDPAIQITSLDPDADIFQPLRRELGVTSFGMNKVTLEPKKRGRVHRHEHQEEVYLVLEGELTLIVESEKTVLSQGMLARVAPEQRRQLTNPGSEPVVLLALGGSGEHVGRDGRAWASWDEKGEGRPPQEVPLPDDLS